MSKMLDEAREYIAKSIKPEKFKNKFHLDVPCGWLNDPNGLIMAFGKYHVFYQHHPFKPENGNMFWGHAVTNDFIHWENLPPAIAPDEEYDKAGCWSGSAILKDGKLYLMYTGNCDGIQQQCLAVSDDGINFRKYENNPVITTSMLPEDSAVFSFRDPYLYEKDGKYFVLLGARDTKENCGRILVYESYDLFVWKYNGTLIRDWSMCDPGIFECPSITKLNGRDLLISSINFVPDSGKYHRNSCDTVGFVGKADLSAAEFDHGGKQYLDYGFDFYAPQIIHDDSERKVLIGWMNMWEVTYPTKEYGWVGSLSFPRELTIQRGVILQNPVKELDGYLTVYEKAVLNGEKTLKKMPSRYKIAFPCGGAFAFEVTDTISGVNLTYDSCGNQFILRRWGNIPQSASRYEENTTERFCQVDGDGEIKLDILLDNSSVEIFINGGVKVMSSTYFTEDNAKVVLKGGCRYIVYKIEL